MITTKTLLRWVTACAIGAAVTSTSQAAFNVLRNGVVWDATFEGTQHPNTPPETPLWSGFFGGGTSVGSDGDIYSMTTAAGNYLYWEQTDPSWTSLGAQRTIEFRARVVAQTASDNAANLAEVSPNGFWEVKLRIDGVGLEGNQFVGSYIPVDNSVFHTYRLTVDESLSFDQAKLYLDQNVIPIVTSGGVLPGGSYGNLLTFGDRSSGGIGGDTSWDFISWDSSVTPVPEPTTCALIGLAGLMLFDKLRRRA